MIIRFALSSCVAFALCILIMPLVIRLSKKLKFRQTILSYVDNHKNKSGTPTMGGIGFLVALSLSCIFFIKGQFNLTVLTLLVTLGYGLIGFIDDFIKVCFKQNKGLSAWQKIIFQLLIATIVSIFAYNNTLIGSTILLPFTLVEIDLGWFAIPFYIGVFIALTNAVNLTDGLDGLAGKVTVNYTVIFAIVIGIVIYVFSDGQAATEEYSNLIIYCATLVGALVGFLCFNGFPAKIFMGDTGALGLGGGLACLAIVSRLQLIVPIIGIVYVVTTLSVAMQVIYFKATKKRIFLMAPLHHHFERKGIHENRIVTAYSAVTLFVGIITIALTLIFAM